MRKLFKQCVCILFSAMISLIFMFQYPLTCNAFNNDVKHGTILVALYVNNLILNQMIISKNPQFTGISARQQLEFTTHLLLTD